MAKSHPELVVLAVVALVVMLALSFAAGYFTREMISRRRRAEARRWREYSEPSWLRAKPPANTNVVEPAAASTTPAAATGELGQMLDRWERRAQGRRAS